MGAFETLRSQFPQYEKGWAILDQIRYGDTLPVVNFHPLSDEDKWEAFKVCIYMAQKGFVHSYYQLLNHDGTVQPEKFDEPDQIPLEKCKASKDIVSTMVFTIPK